MEAGSRNNSPSLNQGEDEEMVDGFSDNFSGNSTRMDFHNYTIKEMTFVD
jgi:hypothetical protein